MVGYQQIQNMKGVRDTATGFAGRCVPRLTAGHVRRVLHWMAAQNPQLATPKGGRPLEWLI